MSRSFAPIAFSLALCVAAPALADDRYPPASFDTFNEGSLNISVLTFRDLNANGVFDLGDLPMAGILVDATSEDLPTRTERSNGSGFANFTMSATDLRSDIPLAGPYTFSVAVPDGWHVTTGNQVQQAEFFVLQGAPADMFVDAPPTPVGLAPDLTISGRVEKGTRTLRATSPAGESLDVPIADGRFVVPASAGLWTLSFDGDNGAYQRVVEVGTAPVTLSAGGRRSDAAGPIEIVDFEGLVSAEITKIPSGYHGLNWQNFVAAYWKFYGGPGYRNSLMSGQFVGYNGSGQSATVFSDEPFDFVGGYVGLADLASEGDQLLILAWRGEALAYQESVPLSALGPTYLQGDFTSVTRIEFRVAHYWQAVFDDLEFRLPSR